MDYILLGVIMLVAAVLRLWKLGQVPFMHDEFSALLRTRFDMGLGETLRLERVLGQAALCADGHRFHIPYLYYRATVVQPQGGSVLSGLLCCQPVYDILQSIGTTLFGRTVFRFADGGVLVQGRFRPENDDKGLCWFRTFSLGLLIDAVFLHRTSGSDIPDRSVFPAQRTTQGILAQRDSGCGFVRPYPAHLLPTAFRKRKHRRLVGGTQIHFPARLHPIHDELLAAVYVCHRHHYPVAAHFRQAQQTTSTFALGRYRMVCHHLRHRVHLFFEARTYFAT